MNEETIKHAAAISPYALVALFSGGASALIVCFALLILHQISDAGMWAIAAMAAAPAAMGIGIAHCMSKRPPAQQ